MIFSLCLFEEVWNKMILYEWRKSLFRNVTPALRHRAWITSPVLSLYEFSASRSVRCRTRTVVSFAIWYRCRRWNRDRTNGHDAFPCICSEITSNDWLWRNNDGWLWRNPKPNIYKIYCTCEQIQNMLYMRTYTKYIVHANIYKIYCTCEHIQNILYMRTYTKYIVHANIYKICCTCEHIQNPNRAGAKRTSAMLCFRCLRWQQWVADAFALPSSSQKSTQMSKCCAVVASPLARAGHSGERTDFLKPAQAVRVLLLRCQAGCKINTWKPCESSVFFFSAQNFYVGTACCCLRKSSITKCLVLKQKNW